MRILIMGGTAFVGRHIAQAAVDAGHDVTLYHRGRTGAGLFPRAAHVLGDRNSDADLAALRDGQWDATVDVNAYLPRQVRALAGVLDGRGGHQLFISTVSVYRTPVAPGGRAGARAARAVRRRADSGDVRRPEGGLRTCRHGAARGRQHGDTADLRDRPVRP